MVIVTQLYLHLNVSAISLCQSLAHVHTFILGRCMIVIVAESRKERAGDETCASVMLNEISELCSTSNFG